MTAPREADAEADADLRARFHARRASTLGQDVPTFDAVVSRRAAPPRAHRAAGRWAAAAALALAVLLLVLRAPWRDDTRHEDAALPATRMPTDALLAGANPAARTAWSAGPTDVLRDFPVAVAAGRADGSSTAR